jgi:hypothetical protein
MSYTKELNNHKLKKSMIKNTRNFILTLTVVNITVNMIYLSLILHDRLIGSLKKDMGEVTLKMNSPPTSAEPSN